MGGTPSLQRITALEDNRLYPGTALWYSPNLPRSCGSHGRPSSRPLPPYLVRAGIVAARHADGPSAGAADAGGGLCELIS
jgi:hypothetical protein